MTDYRRNFIAGGSFFFTVNLADRRLSLLTECIDDLRTAFARRGGGIRSRPTRWSFCPTISTWSGRCPKATRIFPRAGG
jgi:hypothetical protein